MAPDPTTVSYTHLTDVVSDLMPVRAAAEERGGDLLQLVVHLHRVEHAALLLSLIHISIMMQRLKNRLNT